MKNALTIDVEDYFQVSAFSECVKRKEWDRYPLRVEQNVGRILQMLDQAKCRATFFVLGWIAQKMPSLVKELVRNGHEVASHGFGHELVYRIGPERFREDVKKSKAILEELTGREVVGYRAPSYSITKDSLWALDVLIEEHFLYDSSIFPIMHDTYGIIDAPRFPGLIQRSNGAIREFPMSTKELSFLGFRQRVPVAGGAYLRFFPISFIEGAIRGINEREGQPAVIYFHPWELDAGQPRICSSLRSRIRHYTNLHTTEPKIRRLLSSFTFAPMREVLGI